MCVDLFCLLLKVDVFLVQRCNDRVVNPWGLQFPVEGGPSLSVHGGSQVLSQTTNAGFDGNDFGQDKSGVWTNEAELAYFSEKGTGASRIRSPEFAQVSDIFCLRLHFLNLFVLFRELFILFLELFVVVF